MRIIVTAAALCMTVVGLSMADDVHASIKQQTNIPAQPLAPALQSFAKDRGFQIVYVSEEIGDRRTGGAVGEYTPEEALKQLLRGTGLTYKYLDEQTFTIIPPERASSAKPSTQAGGEAGGRGDENKEDDQKKNFRDRFRLAQTTQGSAQSTDSVGAQEEQASQKTAAVLEEVVVTAEKREERIQDVPIPVTAINAAVLGDTDMVHIQDYFASVPGLNLTLNDYGTAQISIRGITTGGYTNPTVGITVDDVPFGASLSGVQGQEVPEIDPSDLDHVEVLRGPQGTLYGAASLGGLVKFVTADPSTDSLFGRLQVGTTNISNSGGLGYNARGSINIPLSDTLAIRGSAFYRESPGYIDDPIFGLEGLNKEQAVGGRVGVLWRPSDKIYLRVSALGQDSKQFGSSEVDIVPGLGDLQQHDAFGTGGFDKKVQAYSAVFKAKWGTLDFSSISGYGVNHLTESYDLSSAYQPLFSYIPGASGAGLISTPQTTKFTQEFRLSMPFGPWFEWMVGAFYNHERSLFHQSIPALDFNTGSVVGSFIQYGGVGDTFSEYAGFTDLTVHVTDRFDIQLGGRESHYVEEVPGVLYGGVLGGPPAGPYLSTNENAFTYLFTPRYRITPGMMVYARLASGFRAGGPQLDCTAIGSGPCPFAPDKTKNYEIGFKGDVLGPALSVDVSVYRIDWQGVQIQLRQPVAAGDGVYYANGNTAKSQGIELSVDSRPVEGLKLAGWVVLSDAALKSPFPSDANLYGNTGDTLPFSTRISGSFSADQSFPLNGRVQGVVGVTETYVGARYGIFLAASDPPPQRQYYGGYATTDFRAGVKYDSWTWNLYADNAFNRRGLLGGGLGSLSDTAFLYIRPRTIGLNMTKNF